MSAECTAPTTFVLTDALEQLRLAGAVPRCHGNGFIQLDVNATDRLHFWGDPRIPRQRLYHGVHDHRFGFVSTVLVGRLLNIEYGLEYLPTGRYDIYEVTREAHSENTHLVKQLKARKKDPVKLWNPKAEVVEVGESYTMFPGDFHESVVTEPTITLMQKTQFSKNAPRVLVPVNREPDNDFHRDEQYLPLLWTIINDTAALIPR